MIVNVGMLFFANVEYFGRHQDIGIACYDENSQLFRFVHSIAETWIFDAIERHLDPRCFADGFEPNATASATRHFKPGLNLNKREVDEEERQERHRVIKANKDVRGKIHKLFNKKRWEEDEETSSSNDDTMVKRFKRLRRPCGEIV